MVDTGVNTEDLIDEAIESPTTIDTGDDYGEIDSPSPPPRKSELFKNASSSDSDEDFTETAKPGYTAVHRSRPASSPIRSAHSTHVQNRHLQAEALKRAVKYQSKVDEIKALIRRMKNDYGSSRSMMKPTTRFPLVSHYFVSIINQKETSKNSLSSNSGTSSTYHSPRRVSFSGSRHDSKEITHGSAYSRQDDSLPDWYRMKLNVGRKVGPEHPNPLKKRLEFNLSLDAESNA
jgi:hypothetical protein